MGSATLRQALVATFVACLLPPASALAARPVLHIHDNFTETDETRLCRIAVEETLVVHRNNFELEDGFKQTLSTKLTFTNPVNGKSFVLAKAGLILQTGSVDEEAGTVTIVTIQKGLQQKYQTPNGPVLVRDAGVLIFVNTYDLETGVRISVDVVVKGPHPLFDSDYKLACEVATDALT
jgi:hypothetical protein